MKRLLVIAGFVVAAGTSTATAQPCDPGGELVEVTEYSGRQHYHLALAAGAGEALVGWAPEGPNGDVPREFTMSRVAADGSTSSIRVPFLGHAAIVGTPPMTSSGTTAMHTWGVGGVGVMLREPDGAERAPIHLDDYRSYGDSVVRARFDGTHFVVTWVAGPPEASVLKAVRFDPDGVQLDATPLVLGPAFAYKPWAASTRIGGVTWVTWSTFTSSDAEFVSGTNPDLVGVRIADDGRLLDATPVVLVPGARGVALAANGDTALLLVMAPDGGFDMSTIDRDGVVTPGGHLALADDEFLLELLAAPGGDGFTAWTTHPVNTGTPIHAEDEVAARTISRTGVAAAAPSLTLAGQAWQVTTDGRDYLLLAVEETVAGATGEERLTLRRFRGGTFTPVTVGTTLVAAPLTLTTTQFCSGPYEPNDGCQAGGPAGAGTMGLIGLGLLALRRRPRRR